MTYDALNRFRLDGRTALVVGAGPGIGAHVARAFASAGANVVVSARSAERVGSVVDEIRSAGGQAVAIAADIGIAEDRDRIVAFSKESFGSIDILFHNATSSVLPRDADPLDVDVEHWREGFELNVIAPYDMARRLIPGMMAAGNGSIITLLSCAAFTPILPQITYGATKSALHMMTRYLAKAAGPNVRANCICPGSISPDGSMNPAFAEHVNKNAISRVGKADEVVGAALLLASDAGSYMTGQVIYCEGGRVHTIS